MTAAATAAASRAIPMAARKRLNLRQ